MNRATLLLFYWFNICQNKNTEADHLFFSPTTLNGHGGDMYVVATC